MKSIIFFFICVLAICTNAINEDFIKSNAWFSATVYKKIAKNQRGNFLVSPVSSEIILALVHAGSRGETAEEIRKVLNLTNDEQTTETTFRNVLDSFKYKNYTIQSANKIYVKNDFPVSERFKRIAHIYECASENIDFERRQKAAHVINSWVEDQTNKKITNLIDPSNLNDRTKIVLVNGLYFKANWSRPFPIAYNKKLDFHLSKTDIEKVEMMLLHEKYFDYFESPCLKARFVELPFKGGDALMGIVLPNEVDGLPLLENQIKKVLKPHKFVSQSLNVLLPKFRVESTVDLKKMLKNMGVSKIFEDASADLSGISGEKGDLVVDKISQKTYIDVSEEGVEGAAATYSLIAIPMSAPAQQPKNFRVDRPFLFYIKINGVIVFIGRVTDPRG